MQTYQIDILNPKASKLLQDLADLELIAIRPTTSNNFLNVVERLRFKASTNPPSPDTITKEIDIVRTKRYARDKA